MADFNSKEKLIRSNDQKSRQMLRRLMNNDFKEDSQFSFSYKDRKTGTEKEVEQFFN